VKEVYTLADLRNWAKIEKESPKPVRLGVIGDPVAHSFSPQMQNAALEHCQIQMAYARFHISPEELAESLKQMRDLGFLGVNVTSPHKINAVALADEIDSETKGIGAINTFKLTKGTWHGFNTDGTGFSRAIREEFSVDLRDLRVLVLGTGGAARAIAMQCAREDCERLVVASRTIGRAEEVTRGLRDFFVGPRVLGPVARLQATGWEESAFRFQIGNVDLIVNATGVGLDRSDQSPISSRLLAPHLMIYDTIYSARRTALMSAATDAGARVANGLSMLLHQGARAFELWFGREAPVEIMRRQLMAAAGPE
jgi:shikimate dehydrogenase